MDGKECALVQFYFNLCIFNSIAVEVKGKDVFYFLFSSEEPILAADVAFRSFSLAEEPIHSRGCPFLFLLHTRTDTATTDIMFFPLCLNERITPFNTDTTDECPTIFIDGAGLVYYH